MSDTTTGSSETPGRHTQWFLTAACSTIAIVAMTKNYHDGIANQDRATKWVVSGISVALVFSVVGVFGSLFLKEKFYGTPLEGGVAVITFGFWAAVIPGVMEPSHAFALSRSGIINANLYFFSWGGLIMSFHVLMSYAREKYGTSAKILHESPSIWGALCLTSFITMISAARLFQAVGCSNSRFNQSYCSRSAWGVSLGLISGLLSATWMSCQTIMSENVSELLEPILSIITFVLWIFGIGYLTFGGAKAPGAPIGNLYFFTWGSFIISVYLAMKGLKSYLNSKNSNETNQTQTQNTQKS